MGELDLTNVRAFHETARSLSFSEAARILGLSQPAVSMRIQALETQLGASLFERGPQGTSLTSAGRAFAPVAEQLLRLAAQAQESVRADRRDLRGQLVIGCSSTAGKYVLPELVASYVRQYPNVDVSIPVCSRAEMVRGLLSGEYNIGVTSLRPDKAELKYSPFFTDHLSLVVPAAHPWAQGGPVPPQDLAGQRLICREPESACREIVQRGLAPHGVEMSDLLIVMEVGSAEALAMAVERGIGMAFVSILAGLPRVALGRLALVEVEGVKLTNPIEWACSPTRAASPELSALLEIASKPSQQSLIQSLAGGQLV